MTPLISIIIPTYNRGYLIGETLDSIIAQTYIYWECIVVDDGSTDNTFEVLNKYREKDSRIQYYSRPKNKPKGANACRNYGFEISKGDYVNWFDSDDIMLPKKLETQIKELHLSTFDFAICQTQVFDVEKKLNIGLRAEKLKSDNIFEDYITYKIFWLTGAPLWKKSFLKKHRVKFDEKLQQAQDYDFHMRILSISQNYFANETHLVMFNIHAENMSKTILDTPPKTFSNIQVKYNILNNYRELLNEDVRKNILNEVGQLYSFIVRKRYKKIAFKTSLLLLLLYKSNGELFQSNALKMLYRTLAPLFYTFLGKGFKLTKLANKIVS
ncbi:glycosyltransferase family 2 protein [Tamlana fucoidanivorans]|uniref:Glycosyltransferase family 2 protein n=1 Tax=Allotamlana fucoidanivorans TaxID=2583814 RepID=A0A5C4SPG7_9FLAO|nr:glycosyltransferase family 2 protein [Tamlana fucoidanivorans]TNJ45770.1 glycosyltransferase family 2 protein [Tamlana fucoidanivorans]